MTARVWDAIIVGAGLAGAAAARELGQAGRSVLVLEARDRVGGRAFTTEREGRTLELGGSFVHWWQGQAITEVMRYGLDVEFVPFLAERCFMPDSSGPREVAQDELRRRLTGLLDRFFFDATEVLPRPFAPLYGDLQAGHDNLSVRDRLETLELHADDRELLGGVLCSFSSGPTNSIGLLSAMRWFALHRWDSTQFMDREHYRILGGVSRLVDAMLSDAGSEIRLETPVAAVADNGTSVTVTGRAGEEFQARAAVLAIPLAALQSIELPLDAPDAWREVSAEGVGSRGLKVVMRATPGRGIFAVAHEDAPLTWLVTERYDSNESILIAFGPDGSRLDGESLPAVQAAVDRLVPGVNVLQADSHDWLCDEFTLGTWGFLRPGQLTRLLLGLQQPHGRITLAGAELANGWVAFLAGAIESGIRAGRDTAATLQSNGGRTAGRWRRSRPST